MENTDFVIEHIDEEVQVIADQPSVVTNYPANSDFFIENIDSNVISIAHSLNIEASEVDFRPANTDFFIENIDKNVIAIAGSMNLSPSEVDFRPANTDFFVENIDKNLIEIAESLSLTPYEVSVRPANTDMFIENIDKNVTLIKGSTNVVTVSGEYININLPDGGKVQSAQLNGNATQSGTPTPDSPQPISVVTGEQTVKVEGSDDSQEYLTDLGSLELAKIGTYQDRIYKDGEKWYVKKQVGKVVLNGSETTWSRTQSATTGLCAYWIAAPSIYLPGWNTETPVKPKLCDNFTYKLEEWKSVTSPCLCENSGLTPNMCIFSGFADTTTIADWKSWLSTHPTTVYYALATPTTTEITNQTLIDQLEALASATLGYGVNNIFTEIATGNAMPTLKLVIEKY